MEAEISTRGFFNKNWSEQDIMNGVENAYNELLQNGMNNGNYVVKIKGEDVTIVIDNGIFRTAWGHHHFSLEDFGF